MESKMQEQCDASQSEYENYQLLKQVVLELLEHREGMLPRLGYIRDNEKSREIIGKLADIVGIGA